jgi:hypothetical protein
MFLSIFNFLKCIAIIFLFIFFPKFFLKILAGKKIFKNKDFYLDSKIEANFKVLEKKIKLKEINLIARGKSFAHVKEHIDFNLPTFFVNFYGIENDLLTELKERDNFFGVTTDFNIKKLMKKSYKKTIFIHNGYEKDGISKFYYKDEQNDIDNDVIADTQISENSKEIFFNLNNSKLLVNFHNDEQQLDIGSALCVLAFFYKISDKINIYGYDHYLTEKISDMNYVKLFCSMFNETNKTNPKPVAKSFIKSLMNYFFIEYFESSKKVMIFSFLKNIKKKKFLINQVRKVFIDPA